ncbi:LAGLIDADG family homing endonuclease [Candidatus Roizmanbacteria bacterium]|nr:LAGLIDADG family homing endonuclease [Candidatus Roizmanbacteria bacterium]
MSSDNVTDADNQQVTKKISDEYFAGFVEGEGCFYIGFGKRNDLPLKWQIITEFHVSQNPGGKNILESFRDRLGCGYIKPNHPKNPKDKSWVLIVKNRSDLMKKLIPFFDRHPLYSTKQKEYLIFRDTLFQIEQGKHLTKKGLYKIAQLVYSLPRITKKRYSLSEIIS